MIKGRKMDKFKDWSWQCVPMTGRPGHGARSVEVVLK